MYVWRAGLRVAAQRPQAHLERACARLRRACAGLGEHIDGDDPAHVLLVHEAVEDAVGARVLVDVLDVRADDLDNASYGSN